MKKYILLILILSCFAVSSCSNGNEVQTSKDEMKTRCKDGVEYFLFTEFHGNVGYGFMSPHWKKDGTLYTCED